MKVATHWISARCIVIYDQCCVAGGAGRERFDGDAEGAGGDEAGVDRDVDRWVDNARLGTFFIEEEG